ncbi:MAG: hypothetical protein ACRD1L_10180, partial [Terriglobales bacterium]
MTAITYTGATRVELAMTFNGGNSTGDTLVTLDGLGRAVTAQRKQSPTASNYDTVSTFYDALDRPARVTMPCVTAVGLNCADAAPETVTTYDALSRPLSVSDGGGGTVSYTYNQNDTLIAAGPAPSGENLKRKQEEFDGLGRLESVCELTSGADSGTCGQTSAQTGYWTTYTRSGGGQITGVTQNAQGSPSETRSYYFDELGRMTAETNPETGTTSYVFDSACSLSSAGDLVQRTDAAGNVACYAHDALHRITQITYPSGPNAAATPTKTFVYDAATVDGTAMQNAAGRLAEAYTGSPVTDRGFNYPNPGGDQKEVYQSSPNSGGWYVSSAQHYPNGVVSSLVVPGLAVVTYGLDGEGRPNLVDGSTTLVGSASYSALGLAALTLGSGDGDSFGYDLSTGRANQFQHTVGGQTATATPSWNFNGTLGGFSITDPIPGTNDNGLSCAYTHDDLGRLQQANCGSSFYNQTFSYDPFGNHTSGGTPSGLVTNFSFTSNRISGGNYDADGNLLADPLLPSQANAFDAEGRAVTLEGVNVVYDALGRAVEASGQEFLYAPDGRKIA